MIHYKTLVDNRSSVIEPSCHDWEVMGSRPVLVRHINVRIFIPNNCLLKSWFTFHFKSGTMIITNLYLRCHMLPSGIHVRWWWWWMRYQSYHSIVIMYKSETLWSYSLWGSSLRVCSAPIVWRSIFLSSNNMWPVRLNRETNNLVANFFFVVLPSRA